MMAIAIPLPAPGRDLMPLARFCACLLAALLPMIPALAAGGDPAGSAQRYEMAALPLDMALARFSEISGVDVLLRAPADGGRLSPALVGRYRPADALARLLEGSGLVARFTSDRSAVILPEAEAQQAWSRDVVRGRERRPLLNLDMMRVTAPRTIGGAPRGDGDEAFARLLVVAIRRMVMEGAMFEGGKAADMRIVTRIAEDGALYDVRIVQGSADQALDARATALLEGANLGLVPPEGLRQPLMFELSGR
ncbi:STN domain-containing protein [Sandaracinobacter sp. RS1-74]|uniref:STN domain-containing protein n=1 Tax=Sandaracinobacteroides sayramensis TaxID=2913411 RepID=UPI001EDB2487|nr:STN domain-containing protein [Sandaracinobacteroides sayramensis]MCG2840441.1 STN domain-containing protein [Sandaracinobacteroides sayramensis]